MIILPTIVTRIISPLYADIGKKLLERYVYRYEQEDTQYEASVSKYSSEKTIKGDI